MTQSQLRDQAAENLRVIRTLLERATVYEAMSGSSALFAGSVALAVSVVLFTLQPGPTGFLLTWSGVLVAVIVFNTVQLAVSARRRGEPFFSEGLRHTLRALWPPLVTGALVGTLFGLVFEDLPACAGFWTLFYGLALLALGGVAPRSMRMLGWFAFLTGLVVLGLVFLSSKPLAGLEHLVMGLAFGVAHFIFGLVASAHSSTSSPPDTAPAGDPAPAKRGGARQPDQTDGSDAAPPAETPAEGGDDHPPTDEGAPAVQTGFVPADGAVQEAPAPAPEPGVAKPAPDSPRP